MVGDVYDASLNAELWPEVLEKIGRFIDGVSALLLAQDVAHLRGQFLFNWNDNPEYTRSFFDHYMKVNPLTPHLMMTKVGEVFTASQLMPYDELTASRFFQEWCVPQGYVDLVGVTLEKSATSVANLSVTRDVTRGVMDDEAVGRMRLLAPHLRRAVLIGKVVELGKLETAALEDSFDGLAAGIFLVDGEGHLTYANANGRAMVAAADPLLLRSGILSAVDPAVDRDFRNALTSAGNGDSSLATKGIAVALTARGGELYLSHILSLASGARRAAGLRYDAVAAIFVRKAGLDLPSPIEIATTLFGLSHAEVRVLYAVMEVGGVTAVAAMLGIAPATVKTHLTNLFAKTGTRRQADLIKLVAGLADPLR